MSNKLIRILSFVTAVLMLLAFVGLVGAILLQRPISNLFDLDYSSVRRFFIIPVGQVLYMLGSVLAAVALCVGAGSDKIGLWSDVVALVLLVLVNPVARVVASFVQNIIISESVQRKVIAFAVVQKICAFPMGLATLAVSLALVICGMSIVYKRFRKELLK